MSEVLSKTSGYPQRPVNEDHVAPRSKYDICQTRDDYVRLTNATEREFEDTQIGVHRMIIIFEAALFLLFFVFIGVTSFLFPSAASSCYVFLGFNVLYLITLYDPVKTESQRPRHETEWDLVVYQLRWRVRYEKIRLAIGISLGVIFCLFILLALFFVDVWPFMAHH